MSDKQDRITAIVDRINCRKTDDSVAATYKDVPDLKELCEIARECGTDLESLKDAYYLYGFLSEQYESMGRFSVAAEFRKDELTFAVALSRVQVLAPDELKELIFHLLRDRNYYVDDDCEDVKEMVSGVIEDEEIFKLFESCFSRRRSLKHDPVEMTKEYLDVIDEVEEKIDRNLTYRGMGACHEIWNLKFTYLMEKGIIWKSPAMLNPRVRFD